MTQAIGAPAASVSTTWSRTRALLAGGIAGGPLFLGVGVVQGLSRDSFDFTATRSASSAWATWAGSRWRALY